ncbi:hypothetical protein Syun_023931 [Stephania yunnanensis]|uniref:Uncharacterized protein n=1 Tax=Stephania yunnanensis TaxID=152371 RepID=A0AAP0F9U4_9MAGN
MGSGFRVRVRGRSTERERVEHGEGDEPSMREGGVEADQRSWRSRSRERRQRRHELAEQRRGAQEANGGGGEPGLAAAADQPEAERRQLISERPVAATDRGRTSRGPTGSGLGWQRRRLISAQRPKRAFLMRRDGRTAA